MRPNNNAEWFRGSSNFGYALEHRLAQKGLTLIELLIVMLIIAMMASVVALNAPPSPGKARTEADRFAVRLNMASEQSVMTGSLIGLELSATGYRFFRYERGEWRKDGLAPLKDGDFPADVVVEYDLPEPARRNEEAEPDHNDEGAPAPNVFFTPTGETTALDVDFVSRRARMKLSLDHAGGLKVIRNDRSE